MSEDGTLRIWNPKSGECTDKVKGYGFHEQGIVSLAMHTEKPMCLTGSTDKTACLVHLDTGKSVGRTKAGDDSVESVIFVNQFEVFGTGSLDSKARIFDLHKFAIRECIPLESGITKLDYNDAHKMFLCCHVDGTVSLFDHRQQAPSTLNFTGHAGTVNDIIQIR